MSRIVTSSEVDRLHCQVAELQEQVRELQAFVDAVHSQLLLPSPPQAPEELFEDLQLDASQEPRSAADNIVDVLASELPSAI